LRVIFVIEARNPSSFGLKAVDRESVVSPSARMEHMISAARHLFACP
jgi:hypothetical protein